jgi:hypothetical protein
MTRVCGASDGATAFAAANDRELAPTPKSPLPKPSEAQGAADLAEMLSRDGYAVLSGLFPPSAIEDARARVVRNIDLFRNTRPNPSSGHLAGFHRYPALEPLHGLLSESDRILDILTRATGCPPIRSIGLSDITVNRSQEWHVDLLRGAYRHHLDDDICWGADGGGVYKALLYLQPGNGLKVMPGAHATPLPLDSDRSSRPTGTSQVRSVGVGGGDVILMDVRLPHRGSTEEELSNREFLAAPKILISTVLGADRKPLTRAMEIGNFERLLDWDEFHSRRAHPQLALNL